MGPLLKSSKIIIADQANQTSPLDWGTWKDFQQILIANFQDQNHAKKTHERLKNFHQGTLLVDEYLSKLDNMFFNAGFPVNGSTKEKTDMDKEKIRILKKGVDYEIIKQIYSSTEEPSEFYLSYGDQVRKIGRMQECLHHRYPKKSSSSSPSQPPPKVRPIYNFITPTSTTESKAEAKPAPKYQPMDVDRNRQHIRCFGCGKFGHVCKDCPDGQKKIDICTILQQIDQDECNELLMALGEEKDQDFSNDQ
jgi:Retrotransposon gag protein